MEPEVALVACLLFVAFLFWTDVRKREGQSISWAPLAWAFFAGSRFASSWLSLSNPNTSLDAYAEGSPIDRAVFAALIVWAAIVLSRRNINWGQLLTRNKWIVLYLLYCLASVAWADERFILVKRWIKDLGNPLMALVILTERRPYEAVGITLRRLAFLFLPLSVVFIKYYPNLGRDYHMDGSPMYTGIGHQKNDLGLMCLTSGLYFSWKILQKRRKAEAAAKSDIVDLFLIGMLVWLLRMSDSQTSLFCLIAAIALFLAAKVPFISTKPSRLIPMIATGALLFAVLDTTFHVTDLILTLLGRDATLTNRTQIWEVVKGYEVNRIVGAGFMSFWTGARLRAIWDVFQGLNQAHNGYLEQYLNLGYIGVAFILAIMLSAMLKVRQHLDTDASAGMLRLSFLVVAALYNYTEASFYGMSNIWLLLLVGCIDTSASSPAPAVERAWKPVARSLPWNSRRLVATAPRQRVQVAEPRRR